MTDIIQRLKDASQQAAGEFRCHNCKAISIGVAAPDRCDECCCRDFSAVAPASQHSELADRLDAMAPVDGRTIRCDNRTTREMNADIREAARLLRQPPSEAMRNAVIEECAAYLDGYAGGHYMAKSCAAALRALTQGKPDHD